MIMRRGIRLINLRTIQNPFQSSLHASIRHKPISDSASILAENAAEPLKPTNTDGEKKKPLNVYFKEAVGLLEKSEITECDCRGENANLKKKLKKLEEELRSLDEKRKESTEEKEHMKKIKVKNESVLSAPNSMVFKKISPDMGLFLKYLYENGYFKGSNFLPRNGFDITCFENSYARDFVKHAAHQFGKDNQEIAKWLSGSDLKQIALFGCPDLTKPAILAAKRLRAFFNIQENIVCNKCSMKSSCSFFNEAMKSDVKVLTLVSVMKVITLYALESGPEELVVPEEIMSSVNRLLKEVTRLSEAVPPGDCIL